MSITACANWDMHLRDHKTDFTRGMDRAASLEQIGFRHFTTKNHFLSSDYRSTATLR